MMRFRVSSALAVAATSVLLMSSCAAAYPAPKTVFPGSWVGRHGLTLKIDADGEAVFHDLPSVLIDDRRKRTTVNGSAYWRYRRVEKTGYVTFSGQQTNPSWVSHHDWPVYYEPKSDHLFFWVGDPDLYQQVVLRRQS